MRINCLGIFLTRKCNFACTYCCTETGEDPPDKMTFDELKSVVLQAKALGAKTIVIPGEGEPLLDENLFSLIDFAAQSGLHTTIFTNGTLVDQQAAQHLAGQKVTVIFKLHSLDSQTYDVLAGRRGAATWESYYTDATGGTAVPLPLGMKLLLDAGYGKAPLVPLHEFLIVETVVARQNLTHIPAVARFCTELGIGCMVETLLKVNRADHNSQVVGITAEEEQRLFDDLCGILGWRFRLRQKRRCRFETNPFLDVSGNIRHCFSLPADIGNIRRMSLAELHEKELRARREAGLMSKRFSLGHRGFRYCASRRELKPVRP
jgi:MoaA/NifB/PqqE/SkfB family radical SAM enzyme